MKLKRTIIAGTTAIAAVVAMSATSVSTFAGTHNNVNSGTQIESIFNTDTDTEVIINLSGNIEELKELKAGVGQKYTINGKEYIIKSVVVISGGGDDGDRKGEVIINSDIKSEDDALVTKDKVKVTVNGDVTAEDGDGVYAQNESVVQINGNVKAEYDGVYAEDKSNVTVEKNVGAGYDGVVALGESTVTVKGNVKAEYDGVYTADKSNVTVEKNVEAGDDGVSARDESTVTVKGNVEAGDDGVSARDESTVTVKGNVEAGKYGVYAEGESNVTVKGDVSGKDGNPNNVDYDDPDDYSDGGNGVYANGSSNVTIGGNASGGNSYGTFGYGGNGVEAYESANVTVHGEVTGGNVKARSSTKANEGDESRGGNGVEMDASANVTVYGNVTGGSTNGDKGKGGAGAYIYLIPYDATNEEEIPTRGKLYVEGTISGGKSTSTGRNGKSGAGIEYEIGPDYDIDVLVPEFFDELNTQPSEFVKELLEISEYDGELILEYLGYESDDIREIIDEYEKGLAKLIAEKLGRESFDLNSEEDMGLMDEEFSSQDKMPSFKKQLIEYHNNIFKVYSDMYYQKIVDGAPVVTTWKVEAGGKYVSPVVADLGEVIAEALNNQHNYLVRIISSENGTVEIDNPTYNPGETIIITPTPNEGYKIASVMVNGVEITPIDGVYSYIMPEYGGVEISAVFTAIDKEMADDTEKVEPNNDVELAKDVSIKNTAPDTGDNSRGTVWSVLTLIATGGLVSGIAAYVKKRKNNR